MRIIVLVFCFFMLGVLSIKLYLAWKVDTIVNFELPLDSLLEIFKKENLIIFSLYALQNVLVERCYKMYCILLYCNALYCMVLYYIVLYGITLYLLLIYYAVLCYIVLYCIVLYCILFYCIALHCIVLYGIIL